MSILNGRKIREKDEIQKNTLYRIEHATRQPIPFVEHQKEKNGKPAHKDYVDIYFDLKETQYGLYGNEYRPEFLDKTAVKTADILALCIDETNHKFASYVFDVKESTNGSETIYKALEQIQSSIRFKNDIIQYLNEYQEQAHIGVITGDYDKEKIKNEIDKIHDEIEKTKTELQSLSSMPIAGKMRWQILKQEEKYRVLNEFYEQKMRFGEQTIPIEIRQMKSTDADYTYELHVVIDG